MPGSRKRAGKGQWRVGLSRDADAGGGGFRNLEDGLSLEEIMEQYDVTREQIVAVLDFAARSLEAPVRR